MGWFKKIKNKLTSLPTRKDVMLATGPAYPLVDPPGFYQTIGGKRFGKGGGGVSGFFFGSGGGNPVGFMVDDSKPEQPQVASANDAEIEAAAARQAETLRRRKGRRSTMITGPTGRTEQPVTRKTTLGGG